MRTGYFKVHITEKVFQPLNISQHNVILIRITGHQTTRNTSNHLLNRHACRHQRHTGSACGCHRGGTVGLKSLGHGTDCIWEFLLGRKYRYQSSLCQRAMPNFTPSRPSAGLCLPYGIRREIIMMHITLIDLILI